MYIIYNLILTLNGLANIMLIFGICRIGWLYFAEYSYSTNKWLYRAILISLILVLILPEKELIEWMNVM